jgi:hypothetical protein
MVTEGNPAFEDSSSSGDEADDDDTDPTADDDADDDGPSGTSSADDDTDDESSSDEGSTSDDGAEADDESSSTGEPEPPDWALEFDGSSRGLKIGEGGEYEWTASDFTVEAWVQITDTDSTGIIFASENLDSTAGWAFYLHPDWHTFVFSYLDGTQINRMTMGPTVTEIGEGWHHLAATKDGTTVFLHVDGIAVVADSQANGAISSAGGTKWTIGGTATEDPTSFWRLKDAVIDDIRISGFPRYDGNFEPPTAFVDDCGGACTINLILSLDEGEGIIVTDETFDVDFTIEDPEWVPGYAG